MYDEVEARSLLAFCLAIGHHFLAAEHPGRARFDVRARAADLLLDLPHHNPGGCRRSVKFVCQYAVISRSGTAPCRMPYRR
ncbi:hypothetical protein ACFWIY_23380 [Streptomyces sioyaensis]|uniref:hypothetical protein n=1 Tax=Streptomyces sioyaensis TaxID=67364 RepID=UPI003656E0AA